MNTIKNPTDTQLQRLMNLIALRASLEEEGIYDSFGCYGWAIFTKDYCEWMEKNYPDLYDKVKTDSDITPIECQFWWKKDGEAGSAGYEAFKKNAEFIYSNDYALKAVCKELKEFYDDFDEYKEEAEWDEMEEEDGYSPWENDFVPFDSEDDYKSALTQFFKDVDFTSPTSSDDDDFDFDAALEPQVPENLYFLDEIHEDSTGGADLGILPAKTTGNFEKDFENVPFIHINSLDELNGVEEGDYFFYDEDTNTITPGNDCEYAKYMSSENSRLRKALTAGSSSDDGDEDEDDDDMVFDPVLGPVSKNVKKLLGDLTASGAQIHGVAPGGGIGGRLTIDKDGNITLPKNDNIESKNSGSGAFDKQKNWKDIPDFDPEAAAKKRKQQQEKDDSDSGIDREQLAKEWREMLGDDFDFTRDVD